MSGLAVVWALRGGVTADTYPSCCFEQPQGTSGLLKPVDVIIISLE